MRKAILAVGMTICYFVGLSQETGTFKDTRDGKVYKTVKIGAQWIMAENLAFKPRSGNYWTYDNRPTNLEKYGYLYDWETAKTVPPKGWHLPTKNEWEQLYKHLGNDDAKVYEAIKSGGSSGFNALLCGYRGGDGKLNYEGSNAHFWSSTIENESNAWNFNCYGDDKIAPLNRHRRSCGMSVRLFRD
jgi:uncharacterized protein (TIGR02145 family)